MSGYTWPMCFQISQSGSEDNYPWGPTSGGLLISRFCHQSEWQDIQHGDFVHSNYLVNFNLPSKLHFNWDALVFYKSMSPFWQKMYLIWIWERWCKICRWICHQVDFNICQFQNFQNSSSFWFKFEGPHSRFCNNFCWRCCLLQASNDNNNHSIG